MNQNIKQSNINVYGNNKKPMAKPKKKKPKVKFKPGADLAGKP